MTDVRVPVFFQPLAIPVVDDLLEIYGNPPL